MAAGYRHTPDGMEGIAAKFADLQRQLDALRASAGLTSAVIGKGGLTVKDGGSISVLDGGDITTFNATTGGRMFLGDGNIRIWDDYNTNPTNYGRIFCDPGSGLNYFRFLPPYTAGTGLENSITIQGKTPTAPGNVWVYSDGGLNLTMPTVNIDASQLALYSLPTTGLAANLRLDTIGGKWTVGWVTSSLRYKQDIEDAPIDTAAFLKLRPRSWRDKDEVAAVPDTTRRNYGFIAEEVAALGLPFVDYDGEGRPDALQYDRFMVGAVQVMQAQQAQLDAQQTQIAALTARLDALEAR